MFLKSIYREQSIYQYREKGKCHIEIVSFLKTRISPPLSLIQFNALIMQSNDGSEGTWK